MHGRLKVRTTEEQKLLKQKEQQKKLAAYRAGMKHILKTRKPDSYNPESLTICVQILTLNPDIYTLWNYRKEVILLKLSENRDDGSEEALIEFLENELRLTEQCLLANPKSYGSWHHRYWTLEHHVKPNWQKEFDLCTKYLTMDERNFHCWDYRRLMINKIGMTLPMELQFSTDRININFSNYSSWHYRSTLKYLNQSNITYELDLVQSALFTDPADSSAWFYLRWILSNEHVTEKQKVELLEALNQLLELEPECRWILLAKCWLNQQLNLADRKDIYKKLEELDQMRKGMYSHQLKAVENESA